MFDAVCTSCQRRELIFPSQVLSIHNEPAGISVSFRCGKGHVGRWASTHAARNTRVQPPA